MFAHSAITPRCDCGVPETIRASHGMKWLLLPKGVYGGLYQRARYYSVEWVTIVCPECGNVRDDFILWKWAGSQGYYPLVPAFPKERHFDKARDLRAAALAMLGE